MAANLPNDFEDNPDWTTVELSPLDYAAMLKVARARQELSQEAAAKMLGLPVATLRNWEQRRTLPDDAAKTLIALLYADPEGIRERLTAAA